MKGGIKLKELKKRIPATINLKELTFLNDKKINGELYAYLQGISDFKIINEDTREIETYVLKNKLPKQAAMCDILGIKSPKTLRNHLNYLIEKEYVIDVEDKYVLPRKEDFYFLIPLKTLQYLNDNCKEHVIKIYVYLGQKHQQSMKNGQMYEFSSEELGDNIGLKIKNSSRGYEVINHALTLLSNSGLIDYVIYFDGQTQKKKLKGFSLEHKENASG